jgi:hypothetical protein
MGYEDRVEFSTLLGRTLASVTGAVGDEAMDFVTDDGETFRLYHYQDCCERVSVEDIIGDLSDLIGSPIVLAEESTSDADPEGYNPESTYRESFTWTFYRIATAKGHVDIRWLGESNGHYSESVYFERVSV